MRRSAAHVQTRNRRPRRETVAPHLVGQALALEGVAAAQTDVSLDVGRCQHLPVLDAVGDVGRKSCDLGEHRVRHGVTVLIPRSLGECVRRVLREDAHHVAPRWSHAGVVRAVKVQLRPARSRHTAPALLIGSLRVVDAARDGDHRAVRLIVDAGRGEPRQPRQRAVHLDHGTLHAPAVDASHKFCGRAVPAQVERALRIRVRDHRRREQARAVLKQHALIRQHRRHRGLQHDHGPRLTRGIGERQRHGAHAAVHVTPATRASLDAAHRVHCVNRGRSLVARPGPRADQPLAVQRGAKSLVGDVSLDHGGDGLVEQDLDELGVVLEQRLDLGPLRRIAQPRVMGGGAQRLTEATEQALVSRIPLDVVRRQRGDRRAVAVRVVPERQRRAVVEGTPEMRVDGMAATAAHRRRGGGGARPHTHTGSSRSPGSQTVAPGCTRRRAAHAPPGRARSNPRAPGMRHTSTRCGPHR